MLARMVAWTLSGCHGRSVERRAPARIWVAVAGGIACGPRSGGEGGDSTTTSATTTTTTTTTTSATTTTATTETTAADASESSSSGNPGADCPPASPEVGAVTHVVRAETWTFADEFGISEGLCSAVDYDGERLQLECTRVGDGLEPHAMAIAGGGPVVADALAAMVGMDGLQLFLPYSKGFFPGFWDLSHFTLRSSANDLLVLGSYDPAAPGEVFAETGVDGWTAPFTELALVDHGCARVDNEPDTAPDHWTPFALEVETDDGVVALFDRQQQTVRQGNATYEVSVTRARMDVPCPADCPDAEIQFSIVRG